MAIRRIRQASPKISMKVYYWPKEIGCFIAYLMLFAQVSFCIKFRSSWYAFKWLKYNPTKKFKHSTK